MFLLFQGGCLVLATECAVAAGENSVFLQIVKKQPFGKLVLKLQRRNSFGATVSCYA